MRDYQTLLASKRIVHRASGKDVSLADMHPTLFPFQAASTRWVLKKGRAALWQAMGLGKTLEEIEWAKHVGGNVLLVAPLAVAQQTARMASMLDTSVRYVRDGSEMDRYGIYVTNYEMLHAFIGADLRGLALDESAILAHIDGKTRKMILESFIDVPYKLSCTATPVPNDISDLAGQAEYLGVMTRAEMLATFFVHDDDGWRLRGHAKQPFFRWTASWAQAMNNPSDLGFDGSAFVLPPLEIREHVIETDWRKPGELYAGKLQGVADRASVRRQSIADRIQRVTELANTTTEQVLIWTGLDDEGTACIKAIPDAIEVHGTLPLKTKIERLMGFIDGQYRVLVTKGKIAGHGLNMQSCHRMIFMGLSDSWQLFHQSIGRCYRYGQQHPVTVDVVTSDHEVGIVENVKRKAREAQELVQGMIEAAKEYEQIELGMREKPEEDFTAAQPMRVPAWIN